MRFDDLKMRSPSTIVLVLMWLCLPRFSDACSCAGFPDDPESAVALAYAQADVVFLGDARSVRNKLFHMPSIREVEFSVRALWKGLIEDPTVVQTNIGEIACGYNFKKNGSYLVFGYWDDQHKILTTSFCDLTRTALEAKDAIVILNQLARADNVPKPVAPENR